MPKSGTPGDKAKGKPTGATSGMPFSYGVEPKRKGSPRKPKSQKSSVSVVESLEDDMKSADAEIRKAVLGGDSEALRSAEDTVNVLQEELKKISPYTLEEPKKQAIEEHILGLKRTFGDKFDRYFELQKKYDKALRAYFKAKEKLDSLEIEIKRLNLEHSKALERLSRLERSRDFGKKISGGSASFFDGSYDEARMRCEQLDKEIREKIENAYQGDLTVKILSKECEDLYTQKIEFEKKLQKMGLLNIADLKKAEDEFEAVKSEYKKAKQELKKAKDESLSLWKRFKTKFAGTKEQKEEAKNKGESLEKAQQKFKDLKNKKKESSKNKERVRENIDREVQTNLDANLDFDEEKKVIENQKGRQKEKERKKNEQQKERLLSEGKSANARSLAEAYEEDSKINQRNIELCVKTCNQIIPVLKDILKLNPKGFPYIGQPFKVVYKQYRYKNGVPSGVLKEPMQTSLSEVKHILDALENFIGIAKWLANCPFTIQSPRGYGFKNLYQDILVAYNKFKFGIDKMQFDLLISQFKQPLPSMPDLSGKIRQSVDVMTKDVDELSKTVDKIRPLVPKSSKLNKIIARITQAQQKFESSTNQLEVVIKTYGTKAKMEKFNEILGTVCDFLEGVSSVLSDPLILAVGQGVSKMAKSVGKVGSAIAKVLHDSVDNQTMVQAQANISASFKNLNKEYEGASKIFKEYTDQVTKNNTILEKQQIFDEYLVDIDSFNKYLLDLSVAFETAAKNYKMQLVNFHLHEHKRLLFEAKSLFKKICLHLMDQYGYQKLQQMKVLDGSV